MAEKYHISTSGEPAPCTAQEGNCPRGGASDHYSSKDEAQAAHEEAMKEKLISSHSKKHSKDEQLAGKFFDREAKRIYGDIPSDHLEARRNSYIKDAVNNPKAMKQLRSMDRKNPYHEDFHPDLANAKIKEEKIGGLSRELKEIAENDYLRQEASKSTLIQMSQLMNDSVEKNDFSTREKAGESLENLEEVRDNLNMNGHRADEGGNRAAAAAYWMASEKLADILNEDKSFK